MAVSRDSRQIEIDHNLPTVSIAGVNVVPFGLGPHPDYTTGLPLRFAAFPFPFTGKKREDYRAMIEGQDMVSGKPMMQALVDGLTTPLTERERQSGPVQQQIAAEPRYLPPDTEENLQRLFKDKGWTDFNPVVLPTEERVQAMLKGTSRKPDEIIKKGSGTFNTNRPFTVETVAIIAVMAGAKPEYMPVLLALASQVPYIDSTTSNAMGILVNGPIRNEIGMNSGIGALGPENEANSVIGRAMNLFRFIIQGYQEGVTGFSSLSNPLRYNNLTMAENEEALPEGWKPLHVQMGFKPEDSVLTLLSGWNFINSAGNTVEHYPPQNLIRDYMGILAATGSATVIMDPSVAVQLHDTQGFATKEAFGEWLSQNVQTKAETYWGSAIAAAVMGPLGKQGLEPYATWQKIPQDSLIRQLPNPQNIRTIVTGGNTASVWFVTDFRAGRGVLIDDWR
jgi:hypothetical protein